MKCMQGDGEGLLRHSRMGLPMEEEVSSRARAKVRCSGAQLGVQVTQIITHMGSFALPLLQPLRNQNVGKEFHSEQKEHQLPRNKHGTE